MAAAAATSSHLLLLSRQQQQAASLRCRLSVLGQSRRPAGRVTAQQAPAANVRCMAAVDTASATATETTSPKSSSYEIVTLTTWLLQQERTGAIDNEMTIVLASISTACKQIAALVQRAPISNLTGVQGAVNVQGEDQKKLDVVSNEVSDSPAFFTHTETPTHHTYRQKKTAFQRDQHKYPNTTIKNNTTHSRCSLTASSRAGAPA
jgi:fructose-1,6-bisphosphatase I